MKRIKDYKRLKRIIQNTIETLSLDLNNMTVLTEAASGNFIVTPLITAMAGARKVYVVCKDTAYGLKDEVLEYLYDVVESFGIDRFRIQYVEDKNSIAYEVNVVTNSGHVRPIDKKFIDNLPNDSAISLMFESWEYRSEDIDIMACKKRDVPVLGVNENDSKLRIFRYVGMSVLKLLLEKNIEVFKSNIILVSSGDYLREISEVLDKNGAIVNCVDTYGHVDKNMIEEQISNCDAIVFAEQKNKKCLLSNDSEYIKIDWLINKSIEIIHIAGVLDYEGMENKGIVKYPERKIEYGYMTVTTDYVGIRPVVELNAAGLKVGQVLVEGKRKYKNSYNAIECASKNSIVMPFNY